MDLLKIDVGSLYAAKSRSFLETHRLLRTLTSASSEQAASLLSSADWLVEDSHQYAYYTQAERRAPLMPHICTNVKPPAADINHTV